MRDQVSPRPSAPRPPRVALVVLPVLALLAWGRAWPTAVPGVPAPAGEVTISVVGTTDLHGRIFADDGRGGLALLGGFVANLRRARADDGGAVVLLDAGDTYQGGIESNLSEGAVVIDAYNALGYTAAAVGNHDFEYGAVDSWDDPQDGDDDPRGALKARASQARFPFLAANLLDQATGRPVDWPNIRSSAMVDAAGIRVGLIGVMTIDALSMTLAANVRGLTVTPLARAIETEAARLRTDGARIVIVTAHAGGTCTAFDEPTDLSSCYDEAEMFEVVRQLPRGLVDLVVAGHSHGAVAHEVNGVAIVQAYSWGRAFSRADLVVDQQGGRVTRVRIFQPREVCARAAPDTGACVAASTSPSIPVEYEGRPVAPDPAVTAAMTPALADVDALRATPIGVSLDTTLARGPGDQESPLGNLFADALRARTPGSDAAVTYSAGPGGQRADLPAGPLTLGALYDVFPFDNGVARLTLTGAELRQLLASTSRRPRYWARALGVSGLRVRLVCRQDAVDAEVARADGRPIGDTEQLVVATTDFLAARVPRLKAQAASAAPGRPLVREEVRRWLLTRGGHLRAGEFADPARPRWQRTERAAGGCLAEGV